MEYKNETIESFIEALSDKSPVPGGGGASALVSAIGMALGNMVGSLTLGKRKYENVSEDIKKLKYQATVIQTKLIQLVDEDARVFLPLAKAYGMPKNNEEEIAKKDKVMEEALKDACQVPLRIMEESCKAILLQGEFAKKGSLLAISDAGTGVIICKAALQGASLNVFINTGAMKDREYAQAINKSAQSMLDEYCPIADDIFTDVYKKII